MERQEREGARRVGRTTQVVKNIILARDGNLDTCTEVGWKREALFDRRGMHVRGALATGGPRAALSDESAHSQIRFVDPVAWRASKYRVFYETIEGGERLAAKRKEERKIYVTCRPHKDLAGLCLAASDRSSLRFRTARSVSAERRLCPILRRPQASRQTFASAGKNGKLSFLISSSSSWEARTDYLCFFS